MGLNSSGLPYLTKGNRKEFKPIQYEFDIQIHMRVLGRLCLIQWNRMDTALESILLVLSRKKNRMKWLRNKQYDGKHTTGKVNKCINVISRLLL